MRLLSYIPAVILAAFIMILGSGCCPKNTCSGPEKEAVKINNYSITSAEFEKYYKELNTGSDSPVLRAAFLDNLINRKLLLQEAQRQGLDKDKAFLESIQNFWEQSLLKIVVDKKMLELQASITVTDKEIEDYYQALIKENPVSTGTIESMRNFIKARLFREKQSKLLDSWIADMKAKADILFDKKALGIDNTDGR